MLKLYICPKCNTFRYVSKKNTTCYKCNTKMILSNVSYSQFIQMDAEDRDKCLTQCCSEETVHP